VDDDLRRFSVRMFGTEYRLSIAAAIADLSEGTPVRTSSLKRDLGLDSPYVSAQLREFVDVGLLTKLGRDDYRREPSAYWAACRSVRDELVARLTPVRLRPIRDGDS
jgi:hypothetical protein